MWKIRILLLIGTVSSSTVLYDYEHFPSAGMRYRLYLTTLSWNQARLRCYMDKADLAMPKTAEQLRVLVEIFNAHRPSDTGKFNQFSINRIFFLACHDMFEEDQFIHLDDHKAIGSFIPWYPGDPNERAAKVNQDCCSMHVSGKLHDYPCEGRQYFFCEKKMEDDLKNIGENKFFPNVTDYNLLYFLWPKHLSSEDLTKLIENLKD